MVQLVHNASHSSSEVLRTVIIGAGNLAEELVDLVNDDPALELVGVMDPDAELKGKALHGQPVLGWLGDLPAGTDAAVIGRPKTSHSFDREAVFFLLLQKGVALPAVVSSSARVDGVALRRGCVVLSDAAVATDALLGENCLLGERVQIDPGATIPDHACIPSDSIIDAESVAHQEPAENPLGAIVVNDSESLGAVIRRINWASLEIILVVGEDGALMGTVTDGDIRRGILSGVSLDDPVSIVMNFSPVSVGSEMPREEMLQLMRRHSIRHLPVVDGAHRPVRLERMEQLVDSYTSQAVVMAGGLGTRLKPFTDNTPKPLVSVGGRPILDHTLSGLRNSGIENVVISLNHMGDQIRRHIGTGRRRDLNVDYVMETRRLGTAGALALLEPRPEKPFVVMNGDLMTNLNYARLLEFQKEEDYDMVLCVRQHAIQIPYGVVEVVDGNFESLREKPNVESFINAGIYVLKPDCIDLVPDQLFFDMTDMIEAVRKKGGKVGIFPILEYWRDIGRPEDLEAAHLEHEDRIINLMESSASIPMENIA